MKGDCYILETLFTILKNIAGPIAFLLGTLFLIVGNRLRTKFIGKDIVYNIVESLMIQAEHLKLIGPEKKKWVLEKVRVWATENKIDVGQDRIDTMIESYMSIANSVNRRITNNDINLFNTKVVEYENEIEELRQKKERLEYENQKLKEELVKWRR